jgi:hypothetical protein
VARKADRDEKKEADNIYEIIRQAGEIKRSFSARVEQERQAWSKKSNR